MQDLADVQTGNDFVAPTPWKAEEHAQVCRENFQETDARLTALEVLVPSTTAAATLLKVTISLTNTEIKALPTTDKILVGAAAFNKRISPVHISVYGNFGAGAYTNHTNDESYLVVRIGTTIVSAKLRKSVAADLTDFSAFFGTVGNVVTILPIVGHADPSGGVAAVAIANNGLKNQNMILSMSTNGNGDLTGGNAANSLKVRVLYMVETEV